MNIRSRFISLNLSLFIFVFIAGCSQYTNFTTYFNTYYNMDRLTKECEDEFEFQDEKKRIEPRVFIPQPSIYMPDEHTIGPPPFMAEFIVNKQKRQPVNVKLDSIVIKGSKILAYKSKSNYVEGSLWLMSKAFFYQEDWINSQIKCSELIDKFPTGDFSPDAHLLYSKNLIVQRKFEAGELMLSRTVDIAWQKKRWDILSEAFRIEAELSLYQNNFEKALRPYRQAITQSDDNDLKAKWQLDMAALLFRIGKFEMAAKEFRKVHSYSPDYLQRFEAYLYEASCLLRIGKYQEGDEILKALYNDGKFEEWRAFTYSQMLNSYRLKDLDTNYVYPVDDDGKSLKPDIAAAEKTGDSAYANSNSMISYYFEKGVDSYYKNDYKTARQHFAKSRQKRTPAYSTSMRMFDLLNNWDINRNKVEKYLKMTKDSVMLQTDSTRLNLADNLYAIGRIHEELGNPDSVKYYYKLASEYVPLKFVQSSQYLHNYARVMKDENPYLSDSLLDVIVYSHPLSEFGKDAQKKLGYTQNFVIDTVAELYYSGNNLMKYGDFPFAIQQFTKIYTEHPKSKFAPKAIYTIGWLYEKNLQIFDSALYYYKLLMEKYPDSEYAKDVNLSVAYKVVIDSGAEIPDSLKTKEIKVLPPNIPLKGADRPKIIPPNSNPQNNNISNPKNLLEGVGNSIDNPLKLLDNIKLPPNPLEKPMEFFQFEENKNKNDSTKTLEPEIPSEEPKK